jgi:hypothetical protein
VAPTAADEFTVCSFNLRGMGSGAAQYPLPGEYTIQLRRRAAAIAEQLQGCTLIALQETGQPKDADALAQMLEAEFGLAYAAVALPGPQSSVSEFPLTNSLLVRRDRVEVVAAAAPQGCSPVSYDVFDAPRRLSHRRLRSLRPPAAGCRSARGRCMGRAACAARDQQPLEEQGGR